jgi:hypothetical protein
MSVPVRDLSGAKWRKSTRSGGSGNQCVEVAGLSDTIAVRDSKNPDGPVLLFGVSDFAAFLRTAGATG